MLFSNTLSWVCAGMMPHLSPVLPVLKELYHPAFQVTLVNLLGALFFVSECTV